MKVAGVLLAAWMVAGMSGMGFAQGVPAKAVGGQVERAKLNQNMTGEWVGTLEYRDYQTNERTFLPTWLEMIASADGRGVTLKYVYDDGPTKVVRDEQALRFAADGKSAMLGKDTYAVTGMEEFVKLNRGTLVLTGPGKENDKAVDFRITVTLRRNLFTMVKESRPVGVGEFAFRDGYTFTRAEAPRL